MNRNQVTKHPALKAIWEDLYLVMIPEMYLRTEEDVRSRGSFTMGDPTVDMTLQNSFCKTYRTINQMFELWREGVAIKVVKYDDTEKIYHAIERHLSNWFNYLQVGFNLSTCPIDDLLELDRFANIVYDKAKYVFNEKSVSMIQGATNSLGINLNPSAFFGRNTGMKFNHFFKSENEVAMEGGLQYRILSERKGYEEGFSKIASRYDINTEKKVKPLSTELVFANDV